MIYFSSDWHLGHSNIIKFCNRPFASVSEMDKAIIDNYHSIVKEDDDFYFLGDFSWYRDGRSVAYWNSLPGRKHFITGNHDDFLERNVIMTPLMDITINKFPVTLCHYPLLSWNRSHFGAISLYGHHHTLDTTIVFPGKRVNVSCDLWDFKPVSWENIQREANKLPNNWDYMGDRK